MLIFIKEKDMKTLKTVSDHRNAWRIYKAMAEKTGDQKFFRLAEAARQKMQAQTSKKQCCVSFCRSLCFFLPVIMMIASGCNTCRGMAYDVLDWTDQSTNTQHDRR